MEQTIWKSESPLTEKKHYSHLFPLNISIPMMLNDTKEKESLYLRILYDNPPKLAKQFQVSFQIFINEEIDKPLTDWLHAKLSFHPAEMDSGSTITLGAPSKKKRTLFKFGFRSRVKTS
jgi:hypothetical protein